MLPFDTPTARLRAVTVYEGISYVLLLFVAMPLKYMAGLPIFVRVIGSAHGGLFIWLVYLIWMARQERDRSRGWCAKIGVASLVPFGFLFVDRQLREEDEEYRRSLEG